MKKGRPSAGAALRPEKPPVAAPTTGGPSEHLADDLAAADRQGTAQSVAHLGIRVVAEAVQNRRRQVLGLDAAVPGVGAEPVGSAVDLPPADAPATPPDQGGEPRPRLLPVRLQLPTPAIELVLGTGAVLRLPPGCDLDWVRSLVAVLGGTAC